MRNQLDPIGNSSPLQEIKIYFHLAMKNGDPAHICNLKIIEVELYYEKRDIISYKGDKNHKLQRKIINIQRTEQASKQLCPFTNITYHTIAPCDQVYLRCHETSL